jgi:hypothetical protein
VKITAKAASSAAFSAKDRRKEDSEQWPPTLDKACHICNISSQIEMLTTQWTRFPGRQHQPFTSPETRVTMGPRGVIYMNEAAWIELDRPKTVELMFDKRRRVIGIVKCAPTFESGFSVKDKKGSKGKIIHASAFCMHFAIKLMRTGIFNEIVLDDNGVMSLYLDTITAITRGAR